MSTDAVDRYQLEELFYESQNSRIYKAWDEEAQQSVALKCFPPERHDAYLREMSAAFGIRHPNINQCLDTLYLEDEKRPCMVYEFIEGGNLRAYLRQRVALPSEEVFRCLQDILKALRYIHNQGFIHCDLKPENILLRKLPDGKIQYILSDLGAAASIREAHAGTHTMSSPAYAAPERLYERFSPSSDLYSLGVIAYEILTGHRPFVGSTQEIARAHLSELPDFARISHPYLREFIARLMDKEPHQRSDAEQALHSLRQLQNGASLDAAATLNSTLQVPPMEYSRRDIQTPELNSILQAQLDYRLDRLLVFNLRDCPLLGLGHDNNLALQTEPDKQPLYLLTNAHPLKMQTAHCLLYAGRSSVFMLDLAEREHHCLHQDCHDLTAFDARDDYLLWCTQESGHLYQRQRDQEVSYRNPNYLMRPVLHLLDEGNFASSEGYMNQNLVIRDAQTQLLQRWILDGPIVQCQSDGDQLLVLTMGMNEASHYSLWALGPGDSSDRIRLPETLVQYCATGRQLFWVTAMGELYCCKANLRPSFIGWLPPERIDLLSISLDHRFIAVGHHQATLTRIQVWQNPN